MAMFRSDADLFFMPPSERRTIPNSFSTLNLLRRDIETCMGRDPDTGERISHQALWPGAMALFAGVDLLANFYAGDDKGQVGKRFTSFVERFFTPLDQSDQDVLYQLRNALLHSFGLYSESKNAVYRFFLTDSGAGALVTSHGLGRYFVDLLVLKNYFDSAVGDNKAALAATPDLQTKFALIFKNYGRIHVS